MLDLGTGFEATMRVLDAMAVRAGAIAHNVANQNTPGYKRFEVIFEERLRDAKRAGTAAGDVVPVVRRDASGPPGVNNVSATEELADLEKVRLLYDLFTRRVAGQLAQMNRALQAR
jgi:flagellar basal-body rod protein FlgB